MQSNPRALAAVVARSAVATTRTRAGDSATVSCDTTAGDDAPRRPIEVVVGRREPCGQFARVGFQTSQTLPTRSGPGLNVGSPGIQPAGVASAPSDSRTNWNACT